jgi:hypothetical protein
MSWNSLDWVGLTEDVQSQERSAGCHQASAVLASLKGKTRWIDASTPSELSRELPLECSNFIAEIRIISMAKRRGNPNWGKPEPIGPVTPTITEFEQVVREFKLTPDQYLRSTRLREWARRNKNSKYIPEPLLEAWGFEIESTL